MTPKLLSLVITFILTTLFYTKASALNREPKIILKAENNKAFGNSSLVKTFDMKRGNIAECLEQCLQDCRCQSFQICQNTKCQLCSSHKEENSSLLHDEDGCVYATYEMRQPTRTIQKLEEQCLDTSCALKYNCCQQAGVCPENKVCKPFDSPTKPWKRFTCECRDGYHGENCDQPIRSCAGHSGPHQNSGIYTVVDSAGSEYSVYCLFDSGVAWTLLLSYSVANGSSSSGNLSRTLVENRPVNENALAWEGYRLRKPRMETIKENSTLLQFTCDYENGFGPENSDYIQIHFENIKRLENGEKVVADVLELNGRTLDIAGITQVIGKMGEYELNRCRIQLHQLYGNLLHVRIYDQHQCHPNGFTCTLGNTNYCPCFRSYGRSCNCLKSLHRCAQSDDSTTQIWFGTRNDNTITEAHKQSELPV